MKNAFLILDIETGPIPEELQLTIAPDFAPDARLKDPEKQAADIVAKRDKWLMDAALHAERGQVLMVGMQSEDGSPFSRYGEETEILAFTWRQITQARNRNAPIVGHYIRQFDLPFLIRRSWKHGIPVPAVVLDGLKAYRAEWLIDLAHEWQLGNRQDNISLDRLAWHLGVGRKSSNGAEFHKLFATDVKAAEDYCLQDIELTRRCYQVMR